jgi:DNA-binding Lrp family transcriptional regulator
MVMQYKKETELNHCPHQLELCEILNRSGLLNSFLLFHRIKYLYLFGRNEQSGGFVRKDKIEDIRNLLGISKSHLCSSLKLFCDIGWATKSHCGYRLKGWRHFRKYAPKLTRLTVIEESKFEYVLKILELYIKNNLAQQEHQKALDSVTGERSYSKKAAYLSREEFSISVRTIAKRLGFKSPTIACELLKELERRGKIQVVRNNKYVCELDAYNVKLIYGYLEKKKCFVKDGKVYQRMLNNIIPIKTEEDIERTRNFTIYKHRSIIRKQKKEGTFAPFSEKLLPEDFNETPEQVLLGLQNKFDYVEKLTKLQKNETVGISVFTH